MADRRKVLPVAVVLALVAGLAVLVLTKPAIVAMAIRTIGWILPGSPW